jgi:PHS family inorganic phosphate transporter-like MFS transporter
MDRVWRIIIGFGTIPSAGAIFLQFTVPEETPRYYIDVRRNTDLAYKAVEDSDKYHDAALGMSVRNMLGSENPYEVYNEDYSGFLRREPPRPFSRRELREYFIQQSNWRYVAGIAACWFILNIALTGLDGSNISTMNILFHRAVNTTDMDISLKTSIQVLADLQTFSWQYIVLISAGSVLGVFLSIFVLGYARRRHALMLGFIALAIALLIAAVTLSTSAESSARLGTITGYILSYLLANFGRFIRRS